MSDLYDTDIVTCPEQQAELLRRVAAGERMKDLLDWEKVIDQIESVGQSLGANLLVDGGRQRGLRRKQESM
jgi:hypothetical protein